MNDFETFLNMVKSAGIQYTLSNTSAGLEVTTLKWIPTNGGKNQVTSIFLFDKTSKKLLSIG